MGVDVIREQGKITSEDAVYTPLVQKGRSVFLCFQVESHKATPKANFSIKKGKVKKIYITCSAVTQTTYIHSNISRKWLIKWIWIIYLKKKNLQRFKFQFQLSEI